jgi:septal ring factor EnvC (AmiA/AmiB activator)
MVTVLLSLFTINVCFALDSVCQEGIDRVQKCCSQPESCLSDEDQELYFQVMPNDGHEHDQSSEYVSGAYDTARILNSASRLKENLAKICETAEQTCERRCKDSPNKGDCSDHGRHSAAAEAIREEAKLNQAQSAELIEHTNGIATEQKKYMPPLRGAPEGRRGSSADPRTTCVGLPDGKGNSITCRKFPE